MGPVVDPMTYTIRSQHSSLFTRPLPVDDGFTRCYAEPLSLQPTSGGTMKLYNGALTLLLISCCAHAATPCQTLYAEHLQTDLQLSYEAFDQTEDSGFRVLAKSGCPKEAADLIERYVEHTHAQERSLLWHIAQLRAEDGDSAEAIRYARKVVGETEDHARHPLRWNDYVLATIAFLDHDKPRLILHRNRIAAASDAHPGNKLNLKLIDSLIRNFDKDYKYAVSHIQ